MHLRGTAAMRILTFLVFLVAVVLALGLLAVWFRLGGSGKQVEITMSGVSFLLLVLVVITLGIGAVLRYLGRRVDSLEIEAAELRAEIGELRNRLKKVDAMFALSIEEGKVILGGNEITLPPLPFRFLDCLMSRGGVWKFEDIIERVWTGSTKGKPHDRSEINSLARRLRDNLAQYDYIKSHPGRGYEFVPWQDLASMP